MFSVTGLISFGGIFFELIPFFSLFFRASLILLLLLQQNEVFRFLDLGLEELPVFIYSLDNELFSEDRSELTPSFHEWMHHYVNVPLLVFERVALSSVEERSNRVV